MNKFLENLHRYRSDLAASAVLGLVLILITLSADPSSITTRPEGSLLIDRNPSAPEPSSPPAAAAETSILPPR